MPSPIFDKNVTFWKKLPAGGSTQHLDTLRGIDDEDFIEMYEYFTQFWKMERGWEYERYIPMFQGLDVVEIGSGLGYDGINYSQYSKTYTFCDINPDQLQTVQRIAGLFNEGRLMDKFTNNNHDYQLIEDPFTHDYKRNFNALYSHGVLHHVPFETAQREFAHVNKFLLPRSKVVLLMYPRQRWEKAGKPDPTLFGRHTDPGCPWSDWYDEEKIMKLVGEDFVLDKTIYWGHENTEFVNFELTKK
jgi:hypothetical protein